MSVSPGDSKIIQFVTSASAGGATNADSLPTGVLVRNGSDTGETVAVANVGTGIYTATFTIAAAWEGGDEVQLRVTATVGGAPPGNAIVWERTLTATVPAAPASGSYLISDAEFANRVDIRSVAELLSDDPVSPIWDEDASFATNQTALFAHVKYTALKHSASARVRDSMIKSGRYTVASIYTINSVSFGWIYSLMARLMVCLAYERRPDRRREDYPVYWDQTWAALEALKYGDESMAQSS